jgi:Kef-type K+ transport system membrane component KefB
MSSPVFLVASIVIFYLVINIAGYIIEKIKIPKIYSALFLGVIFGSASLVQGFVSSNTIKFLSQLGMFSLLFLLGYGLNVKELKKQGNLIIRITSLVILSEFTLGILVLHFFFNVGWVLAGIIAVSFATVGEVALLPILREFKLIKTHLGQTIFGVAILDDIVEILAFIFLFMFISGFYLGDFVNSVVPLVAIVIGAVVGNTMRHLERFEKAINFIALFIFGPFFFFTAGTEADFSILINKFPIILAFTLAIKATKLASAYIASHKQLGNKKSIVLGVSLGIKFSSSIIILLILLQRNLITEELFSVLIGIKIMFKFIVPIVLSFLLSRWHLELSKPIEAFNYTDR